MSDFAALIGRWPTLSEFASDMRVDYGTAKAWRRRNNIPPEHWQALIIAAVRRGFDGITATYLTALAARPEVPGQPPAEAAAQGAE